MRVLEISPIIGSGSVGRIVDQIYTGLISDGHECKVICGRVGNTVVPVSDYILSVSSIARKANALSARLLDNDGFCSMVSKNVVTFIESFDPDIIHMHGAYGYYLNIKPLFSLIKKRSFTFVNTLHSCWDYTGHCCYYTFANCDKWKTGCFRCSGKKEYPASILLDNSRKNYMKKKGLFTGIEKEIIITPSQWLADEVKQSFLREYPVKVIYNGIDIKTFHEIPKDEITIYEKYEIDKEKIIILGVAGVWDRRKGLNDFIEMQDMLPDDIQIVIVGLNEKQRKDLPKSIIGISRTENARELAELYSAASVLFNPTYEDNYPTVNLEAIACRSPVVTYGYGGSGEAPLKYRMGKTVKENDYKEVIEAARIYHKEKPKLDPEVISNIRSERMQKEYIELFESLLSE